MKTFFETNENAPYLVKFIDISPNAKAITEAINYMKSNDAVKDKSIYLLAGNDPEGRVAHGCYISNAALAKGIDGSALAKRCPVSSAVRLVVKVMFSKVWVINQPL